MKLLKRVKKTVHTYLLTGPLEVEAILFNQPLISFARWILHGVDCRLSKGHWANLFLPIDTLQCTVISQSHSAPTEEEVAATGSFNIIMSSVVLTQ